MSSGSQGANFTAGGREPFASWSREAGDSVLVKTEGLLLVTPTRDSGEGVAPTELYALAR
jgi:hypothetical protein